MPGFTYTNQYWAPPIEEFGNYSYAAFSCARGHSSFAIDSLGTGLSSRPEDPSDVQFPTGAAAISQVARHFKTMSILPDVAPFKTVIGIGHSAGSAFLNFDAIVNGAASAFDALILTSELATAVAAGSPPAGGNAGAIAARDAEPSRWGALDPAYITLIDRTLFYPADNTTFSPRMFAFDAFTKDVGSVYILAQEPFATLPAPYTGRVAKIVGSEDQVLCGGGRCVDPVALTAAERETWPDAESFEIVVSLGSGHDLNLDFFAQGVFGTIVAFVEQFSS